jgi:DnaJ-class molecular chaperone
VSANRTDLWAPVPLEGWLQENRDLLEQESPCGACGGALPEACSTCEGEGTIECSECGQERECPECEGEGVATCEVCGGRKDPEARLREFYKKQMESDLRALARYRAAHPGSPQRATG